MMKQKKIQNYKFNASVHIYAIMITKLDQLQTEADYKVESFHVKWEPLRSWIEFMGKN